MDLHDLLRRTAEAGASDLHIHVGSPPMIRVSDSLSAVEGAEPLTPQQTQDFALAVLGEEQKERFLRKEEVDLSYGVPGVGRFRINVFRQRGSVGLVCRRINFRIPTFEELGLPPAVEYLASTFSTGLVLVTGATGSGKSTTLAAMIDRINRTRRCHIVTLEDPIEYLHRDGQSIVTQREIGIDTIEFASGLRSVLRQDPDVILIGEMRDPETIQAAITAAETGHLVFSTLHTTSASGTIERILEYFPETMRPVIRQQLTFFLRGVICQRLVPRLDGQGVLAAVEVMLSNPLVRKCILSGKLGYLKSVIHQAANEGMQTMDQHLVALYTAGVVSFEAAQTAASNPDGFHMFCQGFFSDIVSGIMDV